MYTSAWKSWEGHTKNIIKFIYSSTISNFRLLKGNVRFGMKLLNNKMQAKNKRENTV